jgi:hypothetical protein
MSFDDPDGDSRPTDILRGYVAVAIYRRPETLSVQECVSAIIGLYAVAFLSLTTVLSATFGLVVMSGQLSFAELLAALQSQEAFSLTSEQAVQTAVGWLFNAPMLLVGVVAAKLLVVLSRRVSR